MILETLRAENEELRRRMEEAEETIRAIQNGAVDAFVVQEAADHQVYTLEAADRPYRLFVEQMQQGAATLQGDGTIVYCNGRLADMLSMPQDKLTGMAFHDCIAVEDQSLYENLLRQGQTRSGRGEARLRRADGGLVPTYLTFYALRLDCGTVIRVLITDLTSQRHHEQLMDAHEALRESEERQAFLLALSDALRPLTTPTDIAGLTAERLGERFGLNRVFYAEIAGSRMTVERDYARDVSSLVGEHNLEAFGPDMLAAYRDGAVIVVNDVFAEPRLNEKARAGLQSRQVGAYVDVVLFEVEQRVGLLALQSATPRNWTAAEQNLFREVGERVKSAVERARAEEALRQANERFDLVSDAAEVGFWFCDLPFDELTWDHRVKEHFWLPPEAPVRIETFYERLHPDDRERTRQAIETSIANNTRYEIEYRTLSPDGEEKWIRAIGRTFYDEHEKPIRFDGVTLDITERKRTEERLTQFTAELEQGVAERTYELAQSEDQLRTLAKELNLAEQRERKRLATELHDHLQQMLVLGRLTIGQGKRVAASAPAVEQILKKVDDIFSDSLTYTRTLVSDLSPTVLRDQGLAAALQWLGTYMQKYHQTVTVTVPDDEDLKLPEDQVILLFQSVRELLINSSKHAGTGQAAVTLEQRDGLLRIDVRDEGAGFDLAAASASSETTSGGISSKFGLFSIRERMRALGGSFELESAPGQGTTAMLMLPVGDVRGKGLGVKGEEALTNVRSEGPSRLTPHYLPSHASPLSPHPSRVRVLLVDDHTMVRQGLKAVLDGYTDIELVGEAADGEQAVAMVERLRPAVIVMDINMPKMNGIEATAEIKARYPETIVVGLSVNSVGDHQQAMLRAGAVRLMTKEAVVEQLYDAIQEAVKKG